MFLRDPTHSHTMYITSHTGIYKHHALTPHTYTCICSTYNTHVPQTYMHIYHTQAYTQKMFLEVGATLIFGPHNDVNRV